VSRIEEDDVEEVGGPRGAVDRAAKSLLHEQGQSARVIDVTVREENGIDGIGREGRGRQFRSRSCFNP
jgi:hypothetical protein